MLPDSTTMAEKPADVLQETFMRRCLQLAMIASGNTAPNPMVGAVLVHGQRIIGEGFHEHFGGPHAEVNCIHSVKAADKSLIPDSTLYVSLEPCAHHGKTPPCADLIIQEKIQQVVVACRDPFPEVDGKGMDKLLANQVELIFPMMEWEAIETNRRFFTFHQHRRPFVILKWAESANHKMAGGLGERSYISNAYSNRQVHKWRSEEAAVLVGTQTAMLDDPLLTNRLWTGKNPVRIVLDKNLRLPGSLHLFDGSVPTVIVNTKQESSSGNLQYKKIDPEKPLIPAIMSALYSMNLLSVLVEGGSRLLQTWIDSGIWDECRVITNNELKIKDGSPSPALKDTILFNSETYFSDTIHYYRNKAASRPC